MANKGELGALWKGEKFLSGTLDVEALKGAAKEAVDGKIRVVVFKNNFKSKKNHPDYNILISTYTGEKKEEKKDDSFFD